VCRSTLVITWKPGRSEGPWSLHQLHPTKPKPNDGGLDRRWLHPTRHGMRERPLTPLWCHAVQPLCSPAARWGFRDSVRDLGAVAIAAWKCAATPNEVVRRNRRGAWRRDPRASTVSGVVRPARCSLSRLRRAPRGRLVGPPADSSARSTFDGRLADHRSSAPRRRCARCSHCRLAGRTRSSGAAPLPRGQSTASSAGRRRPVRSAHVTRPRPGIGWVRGGRPARAAPAPRPRRVGHPATAA
jgi:hypothetical protein